MPPNRKFPGQPGDELPLEGIPLMEREIQVPFDPNKRVAFGSVPRLLDIQRDQDIFLRPTDFEHASSDYIQQSLTRRTGIREIDGVPFGSSEHALVLLNVQSYAGKVATKGTKAKNRAMANPTFRKEAELKDQRNALGRRFVEHTDLFEGLKEEVETLRDLRKLAGRPGYALEKGGRILQLAAFGWKCFEGILTVVAERENWSPDEAYRANQAMLAKLTTGGQRDKIAAWQSIADDSFRYAMRRYNVVGVRHSQLNTQLKEIRSDLESLYAETGFFEI